MSKELSPQAKERLQMAAIWLMALSLPFVLCWVLLKTLFQMVVPRKTMTEREEELQFKLAQWTDAELNRYRAMPFSQLSTLPPRLDVSPPPEFQGPPFVLAKRVGDNGGVEIQLSVRRRFFFFEMF